MYEPGPVTVADWKGLAQTISNGLSRCTLPCTPASPFTPSDQKFLSILTVEF